MSTSTTENDRPLTETEALDARGEREGAAWFRDNVRPPDPTTEGTPISHPPSATPISGRAFDMIVGFEVSSEPVYEASLRGATWPGGDSGVTIGIGYDVGYVTPAGLRLDWGGVIPAAMLDALSMVVGITGRAAEQAAAGLSGKVDIPFSAAISVHRGKVIPQWVGLTQGALPNCDRLSADSLGSLVSLTYNRGASYSSPKSPTDPLDRFLEMRNIRAHMDRLAVALIPAELRAMKRLWPDVRGLRIRRDQEAQLFQDGLSD